MSKRRNTTPYPHSPNEFVRELMRSGWRRCDAEGIDLVRSALEDPSRPGKLRERAVAAAAALEREPVLAGSVLRLIDEPFSAPAVLQLIFHAGPSVSTMGLARLFLAAKSKLELGALQAERYCDDWGLEGEPKEFEDLSEELG